MDDLVKRLRAWAMDIQAGSTATWAMDQDLKEAAKRIEAMEAALRPFADIGIGTDPEYQPMIRMNREAIVAARAALEGK